MIANYHTHTWRCSHATGTEEEYVQAALDRKIEILGFSDHTPYGFPQGYDSWFRMKQEQLADYCNTVRTLEKTYAGQIRLPLGVEMEYYPALFDQEISLLREAGVEYLLLGQHFVDNEVNASYSGHPTGDAEVLNKYVSQARDGMQTGLFTYLAHPDLINFQGDPGIYRQAMLGLCREAKGCGMPLELNMLGKATGRHYPNDVFWELAAETGCDVILGCDAHSPEQLRNRQTEAELCRMVKDYGLNLLQTVPLRSIG